jgi:hypothetical protein
MRRVAVVLDRYPRLLPREVQPVPLAPVQVEDRQLLPRDRQTVVEEAEQQPAFRR